ncbi:protein tiptop-like isoform X2 [Neocloeon triangulifer]|nr:protein tiptop-like isoform X2 [Neocloeon triangulifer]
MQSPRCESRDLSSSVGRSVSRSSSEAMDTTPGMKRHLDSEDENVPIEEGILDFSKKKHRGSAADSECLNLSKGSHATPSPSPSAEPLNGPLDLSCSRKRNAQPTSQDTKVVKQQRTEFPKNSWTPANFPFGFNSKLGKRAEEEEWNGKSPMSVKKFTETSKSLNELSKLGEDMFRNQLPPRQTAWQSHWVNKGSIDKNKEVFKCVWCKSSFHTLAQLTTHMKETSHCNSNAPPSSQGSSAKSNSDLNLLIKETMPLPRKLVRGQDVWLGKGAEQTRQILKCMWCGQSFRSLAEMTSHMQQTQHYTNIISQEQIISWKSAEENPSAGSKATSSTSGGAGGAASGGGPATTPTPPPSTQQSHVTAVLTCKVCDQAFSSLKDLSAHMVKNSHYKEHIMRSITESGGRRRQNREKRKKSLPVRKLLELERAQHEINVSAKNGSESIKKLATSSKISCEKCGEKIDTSIFVEHIRLCVGNARNLLKSALLSNETTPEREVPSDSKSGKEQASPEASTGNSTSPSVLNAIEKLIEKSFDSRGRQNFHHSSMPNPNLGSSILKRLGIDESADYTKPLVDSASLNLLRNYPTSQLLRPRERSGSESSSRSRSQTPDRKSTSQVTPLPATIDENSQPKAAASPTSPKSDPKSPLSPVKEEKQEFSDEEKLLEKSAKSLSSPKNVRRTPSPAGSERSEANERDSERSTPKSDSAKSLNALSNMYDSLSGKSSSAENGGASGKNPSSHPLAALQKLCDYTDRTSATSSQSSSPLAVTNPGAILAFTWACNDAVVGGNADSALIKCAFCDTPFISKGAYRHHLSKMHFVKDGNLSAENHSKSNKKTPSPPVASTSSESNSARKTPPNNNDAGSSSGAAAAGSSSAAEESPHSKFLKYTELAKQLSSKYV